MWSTLQESPALLLYVWPAAFYIKNTSSPTWASTQPPFANNNSTVSSSPSPVAAGSSVWPWTSQVSTTPKDSETTVTTASISHPLMPLSYSLSRSVLTWFRRLFSTLYSRPVRPRPRSMPRSVSICVRIRPSRWDMFDCRRLMEY